MTANLKTKKLSPSVNRKRANRKYVRAQYQAFVEANNVANGLLSTRGCIPEPSQSELRCEVAAMEGRVSPDARAKKRALLSTKAEYDGKLIDTSEYEEEKQRIRDEYDLFRRAVKRRALVCLHVSCVSG